MIRRQPSSTLFPYTTLSRSYGDGRSEKLISRLLQERPDDEIFVATKAGRRLDPHTAEGYNKENLTAFVERRDRKSTRLNSSHANISYAVFCLKKKIIAAQAT